MVEKYPDVVLRKVDIVSGKSEAAAQASKEFGLSTIPYVRMYSKDGKDLGPAGQDISTIEASLKKALQ